MSISHVFLAIGLSFGILLLVSCLMSSLMISGDDLLAIPLIIAPTIPLIVLVYFSFQNDKANTTHLDSVKNAYTIYLDGEEVDSDTIEISQYRYYISDENESIYLTK